MTKAKEIVAAKSPYRLLKWKKNHLTWYYGDFRITTNGDTTKGLTFVVDRIVGYSGMTLRYKKQAVILTIADAKQYVEVTTILGVEP